MEIREIHIDPAELLKELGAVYALANKFEAFIRPSTNGVPDALRLLPRIMQIGLEGDSYCQITVGGDTSVVTGIEIYVYPASSQENSRYERIKVFITQEGINIPSEVTESSDLELIQKAISLIPRKCFEFLIRGISDVSILKASSQVSFPEIVDMLNLLFLAAYGTELGKAFIEEFRGVAILMSND